MENSQTRHGHKFSETILPESAEDRLLDRLQKSAISRHPGGWIKLYRQITEWQWYKDANTKNLFIHLLLKANTNDAIWMEETIKRGELITSISHLASALKLTPKQIRGSLDKLKRTHEVTTERANNSTKITITNYDIYQAKPNNERQTIGQTIGHPKGNRRANRGQTKGDKQEEEEGKEEKED